MQVAPLPLIGRQGELHLLRSLLIDTESGSGGTLILHGASGVGKSRLLREATLEANRRGWICACGRAYPVVSGIPYAPFTDAFLPLLRRNPDEYLSAPGAKQEFSYFFPMLHSLAGASGRNPGEPAELRTRLLFNLTAFLSRMAARTPLLLVLDDLQWADASSLELLHFIARQTSGGSIAVLCAYNDAFLDQNPQLRAVAQSLAGHEAVRSREISSLSAAETGELLRGLFGSEGDAHPILTALLYRRTLGNPFFLEEVLKSMVASEDATWREGARSGHLPADFTLPHSVRDAVLQRLSGLSAPARKVADLMSVIGTDIPHASLQVLVGAGEDELVQSIEELRRLRVLEERLDTGEVIYDFTHPILRETLYGELGLARTRYLHGRVADLLEARAGVDAMRHADVLAYHFSRSHATRHAEKAVRYLRAAGQLALEKYSNQEAADYLSAAIELAPGDPGGALPAKLLEDLARAKHRLGDFDSAYELLERVRGAAAAAGDAVTLASIERRLGRVRYSEGRLEEALTHYGQGLEYARRAGQPALVARLELARGDSLLELGHAAEALSCVSEALPIAESLGDEALTARVHLALLLLLTWAGEPRPARAHGEVALAKAEGLGDTSLCCTVHWALAIHFGFTGDSAATGYHSTTCVRLAEELQSPLHRLRSAELQVEFNASTGDWVAGLTAGERAISSARALRQNALLARLLVWTGVIHIGRGDHERGRRYVEEAWSISHAGEGASPPDVHVVVPAHYGVAAYLLAAGDYAAAIRIGTAGLEIAERAGYSVWGIHRLLPIIGEAYLTMSDGEGAARIGARLRRESERLGHPLGLAWADACDGFLIWLRGDNHGSIRRLRRAAERLEAIGVTPDAARVRRHLAARLRDVGDREEALNELRHLHEVFSRLGARVELTKTREQIRELGGRPPPMEKSAGVAGLSARELEIGRLVAARRTNKAIARQLGISPRTVGTHLSNVFRKLQVDSRAALAEKMTQIEVHP